jgi:hypothetical protein
VHHGAWHGTERNGKERVGWGRGGESGRQGQGWEWKDGWKMKGRTGSKTAKTGVILTNEKDSSFRGQNASGLKKGEGRLDIFFACRSEFH